MDAVSIRSFNVSVKTLTDPVKIVTFDRKTKTVVTLGFYYPKGTEPKTQLPDVSGWPKADTTTK